MARITGPIPNRSDQRVRRNVDVPIDKVTAIGKVPIPPLNIPDAHPFVTEMYEAMKKSAQNKYYEPTDWTTAKVAFHFLNKLLWSPKPSSQMLAAVNQMLTSLLLTEGDRRRVRLEVERKPEGPDAKVISIADMYREQLGG